MDKHIKNAVKRYMMAYRGLYSEIQTITLEDGRKIRIELTEVR